MPGRKHGRAPGIGGHPHGFAGVSTASFSPASLPSPLLWLRADSGVTFGTGVSAWIDLSGNGKNAIQNTGANQPAAYNTSDAAYNNQSTVQTTAAAQFLVTPSITIPSACSFLLVGQFSTNGNTMLSLDAGALHIDETGGFGTISAGTNLSSGIAPSSPMAMLGVFNGASSFVGINNWLTGGTSGNAGTNSGAGVATIFAFNGGSFGETGKIAELFIWGAAATSADKTNLANYVKRYGLTVT